MTVSRAYLDILCNYHDDYVAWGAEPLGSAGGYSGAAFWKVRGPKGTFCLRRWSENYPSLERLQFIHAIQWHAKQEGFYKFPMPVETLEGMTYVSDEKTYWQLEPWMEGKADFHKHPGVTRLVNAMTSLAEFHKALSTFPVECENGTSPTLLEHEKTLLRWTRPHQEELEDRILLQNSFSARNSKFRAGNDTQDVLFISDLSDSEGPAGIENWRIGNTVTIPYMAQIKAQKRLQSAALRILPMIRTLRRPVLAQVVRVSNQKLPLQPCIHDIHAAHLFFERKQFRGLIDFGSVGVDSVAVDVARMLNTLTESRSFYWLLGLTAYQSLRRFSPEELDAIQVFRRSTVLTTAIRWLNYIFMQNQPVKCSVKLVERMEKMADMLERI